ncbi:MAG: DUF3365 domain-containing protein [Planctomycetaceae bacterium]
MTKSSMFTWTILLVSLLNSAFSDDVPSASQAAVQKHPVTLSAAKLQAAALHEAMHSALRVTHDRFYREDEGLPIPAATLKEVFADLKQKQNITLRWLVVEGQAMNTDHVAQDDFEREAVAALKSGRPHLDKVQDGIYRRAGPITLSNHCLKCHVPDRRSTDDRTAGLLISIPIQQP